ncbi:hypothetical protein GCM10010436_31140 [Paractinoplanes durhamensis]
MSDYVQIIGDLLSVAAGLLSLATAARGRRPRARPARRSR